ncbi:M1 family metallopeptidase [Georgenia yuyongxinii]|uniref:Aminopeptidase N n=1 Tax=Georgenia yuyongxinii TaxID=2589797 RepID=A0A552WUS9_9MICO|nr:M1 family metallopeptidase [Georgenia yuyongxinii]TRW46507.1 M1 family metallopeptidase [Georgenia yuyongxinii]
MRADSYDPRGCPDIHVEHYDLDLVYKLAGNRLSATAVLRVTALTNLQQLELDLTGLTVKKVSVGGARLLRYAHRGGRLQLRLAAEVPEGATFEVTVRYDGHPVPVPSPWGTVGWEELTDGALVASQPTGASSWFPCNDRPADRSTYRTSVTTDNGYHVLAHGTLVARRARAATTTWVYAERHPTAAYLATVQIGRYVALPLGDSPVPQHALVPATLRRPASRLLARHGEMMRTLTEMFGPYPFTAYTLVFTEDELEIPVEAQGISVFGANHVVPTDGDERLVPHELAHQWFGNSVSVTTWQHIWLNEGFACYAEWLWSPHAGGRATDAMARHWHTVLARAPQDLVLSDPGPANIFDDRIYKRGALTLHALRLTVGDQVFFDLVRDWTARYRYRSVTTADFRALAHEHAELRGGEALADAVGALLGAWLDQPRLPALPRR